LKLSEACIRQPVFAIVLTLVIVVLGLIGFQQLEIRFFPKFELPVVTITTHFDGASAGLMESQVTTVLENSLAGIDGIQYMSSSSWTSYSRITVQFHVGGNLQAEAAAVRDKIASVRDQLPTDIDPPTVTVGTKGNPLIGIGYLDSNKKPADIRDYVVSSVLPVLRQVKGVGSVSVLGASNYAMRIWLKPAKMAALGVTVTDIKNAIDNNNIYFPAGSIHGLTRNYGIVSDTRLKNAEQFQKIVIKRANNKVIRIKDVAKVELGYSSLYDYPMRIGGGKQPGQNGILLIVEPLQTANPIEVAKRVRAALANMEGRLPPGMHSTISFDLSNFLKSSIDETFVSIAEAVILVILVVYLFLGSLRAASIPIITIPVSLISVFFIINLLGFTIDTMSLLGMVLAIGLVVDDAIVMLENIHRHIEEGMPPLQAAIQGSREIGFAIIAMALTLVAVYAPIGFVQGFTAKLFQEFAFTLVGAVIISAFVALTLSPMMCSRILLSQKKESRLVNLVDRLFHRLSCLYEAALSGAIRRRNVVVIALAVVGVLGYLLFINMSSEFLPQEDYGVMNIGVVSPTGASIGYTEKYTKQVEAILKQFPEIQNFSTQVGISSTTIRVTMKPWNERTLTTEQVVAKINPILAAIPGVNAVASIPNVVDYGEQGSDLTLNFMTTGEYQDLMGPMNAMLTILKNYPGLYNVNSNLKFDSQQYAVSINRDLAATLGVNIQDVANTITAMMSGNHWTDVQSGSRSYPVMVQLPQTDLKNFDAINQLYVSASNAPATNATSGSAAPANMVPLSSLITLTPTVGQGTLRHFDRMRSGTVTALLSPGYTESEAIDYVNQQLPQVLNSNVRFAYSGKAAQYLDSAGSMTGIMALSFVFIFLVLAAQFGSFLDPFIILLGVPLSLVGALFSLWLGGGTFNLFSEIGLVTLVGMISKHGILITQFINNLRQEGMEMSEAIVKGAMIRLRPVLMTTLAMIFGSLPLALAQGPGSVGRHQIGWVIVGGLFFGTFFSLIVVPIAYSYLGRFKKELKQR